MEDLNQDSIEQQLHEKPRQRLGLKTANYQQRKEKKPTNHFVIRKNTVQFARNSRETVGNYNCFRFSSETRHLADNSRKLSQNHSNLSSQQNSVMKFNSQYQILPQNQLVFQQKSKKNYSNFQNLLRQKRLQQRNI